MILVDHRKVFVAWHWRYWFWEWRRPSQHTSAIYIGPLEIAWPDAGYWLPR